MNFLKLTHDKLSVEDITNMVSSPSCGAISVFMGTTRDNFEGKIVETLEYEAYESMALKVLEQACQEIRVRWTAVENIAIYHRLGLVAIKESSVIIAVSSPHRGDAMEATQWCIDHVKKMVPIWKKENYTEELETKTKTTKKRKLNFEEIQVDAPFINPHLVQIKAQSEEVDRRIEKFIERKRELANLNNIKDFCVENKDVESTCARVDAVLVKKKDSKGHLGVQRVFNYYNKRTDPQKIFEKYDVGNGIEERVKNLEKQLNMHKKAPKDMYERLKSIEDRLLFMESISPEYINFWEKDIGYKQISKMKRIFSIPEIDTLISELKEENVKSALIK